MNGLHGIKLMMLHFWSAVFSNAKNRAMPWAMQLIYGVCRICHMCRMCRGWFVEVRQRGMEEWFTVWVWFWSLPDMELAKKYILVILIHSGHLNSKYQLLSRICSLGIFTEMIPKRRMIVRSRFELLSQDPESHMIDRYTTGLSNALYCSLKLGLSVN